MNPVLLQTNITFNLPSGAAASWTAPQNVRNKTVFNDSSTDNSSSEEEEEEEDQDTVDARNQQYTEDIHNDDAETEAPQQQIPEQTPEQSGAPADNARADDTIVVPLTAEEMVILTSGDEEPAAEQEKNQPPGPLEVFSIGLNEQQTPVSCKWGSFCFPLSTLLLFIYVFAKYYVSFQLLLKLWRTVHQRLGMQSSSFSTNLNLNRQQYVMLHRLQVGPFTLPQCRLHHLQVGPFTLPQCHLHHLQVGLHKVQYQVTFFQLCCLVIGFTNSCFFPLLLFALIHF